VEGRLIKNLSKGYKQRVGIAQALIGMPEIIILDEPTVGLDPKQIIEIRELIKELGKKHTIILSSHILSEISEVCEHIFIVSKGKLVASGSEEQLVSEMAGNNTLLIDIKGSAAKVEEMVKGIDEIVEYSMGQKGELTSVEIVTEKSVDIRENIFELCASLKMPIYKMDMQVKTLEDIFIELTADNQVEEITTVYTEEEVHIMDDKQDVEMDDISEKEEGEVE